MDPFERDWRRMMNENKPGDITSPPEPGAGSSYGHGLASLKKFFLEVLLITLVCIVFSAPVWWTEAAQERATEWNTGFSVIIQMFALGYWLLILGPVEWGADYAMLKAARGEKPEFMDIFVFQKNYINVVLARLLSGVIVVIGFVFLIVPGMVFACKLAFVPYLVTDRKMEATEAIRESWRMTTGHAGTIFLMGLIAIPVSLAGIILLGVGFVISLMWIGLAFASIYAAVAGGAAAVKVGEE
jgi:uncharacterized membrane protein